MATPTIEITPFDNEISVLYKEAELLGQPVRLVVASTTLQPGEDLTPATVAEMTQRFNFESITTLMHKFLSDGLDLFQIQDLLPNFDPLDLAMVYYGLQLQTRSQEELMQEINAFYRRATGVEFSDLEDLNGNYGNWSRQLQVDFQTDMDILQQLRDLQDTLNLYPAFPMSPINVHHTEMGASPILRTMEGEVDPQPSDGIDIFNASRVSDYVPYIQLTSSESDETEHNRKYYKVYQGQTKETRPDFSTVVLPSSKTSRKDTFYLTVWSGEGDVRKATKESYMKAIYRLDTNNLQVRVPTEKGEPREVILSRLETALPVRLGNRQEVEIGGEFSIYGVEIVDTTLLDMVLTDDVMSSYLYMEESSKSYPEKERLGLHYRSALSGIETAYLEEQVSTPSSIRVTLYQMYLDNDTEVEVMDLQNNPVKQKYPGGTPYIHLKITKSRSLRAAQQFAFVFNRLLSYYMFSKNEAGVEQKNAIAETYAYMIPGLDLAPKRPTQATKKNAAPTKTKTARARPSGGKGEQLAQLQEIAPDLFIDNYATYCQKGYQPKIITPAEVETWRNQSFTHRGKFYPNRQIMPYPRENPQWYFVCDHANLPFPGVKENKKLANKDKYPYIPCCYPVDQTTKKSGYQAYYMGVEKKTKTTKSEHKIKTNRFLETGRKGFVPNMVQDLIRMYDPNSGEIDRLGVTRSVNSFIHCVLTAVKDQTYIQLRDDEERENYASQIRRDLVNQVDLSVMRQELYDFDDDSIRSMFLDPERFFDPQMFYRSLEERYQVNIYVISPSKDRDSETTGQIEVPRNKFFHARSPRYNRQTIIIYKHTGGDSDAGTFPQCELIVDNNLRNRTIVTLYDGNMSRLMHRALLEINRTITWEVDEPSPAPISARSNIYSLIDYPPMFKDKVVGQILDSAGKLRAFLVQDGNDTVTLAVPPTQPENLPQITMPSRPDYKTVLRIMGNPTALTRSNEAINGLWYEIMDLEQGVFCPIKEVYGTPTELIGVKLGMPGPLSRHETNVVDRIKKLHRTRNVLLQLFIWLYLLSKQPVDQFFVQNFAVSPTTGDSSEVYQLENIPRRLPEVNTFDEAIGFLERASPTLVKQGKILLYSPKFAEGIAYFLQEYDRNTPPEYKVLPFQIQGLFDDAEDFISQNHTAIFTSEVDLKRWLRTIQSEKSETVIRTKLDLALGLVDEPYFYGAPDKKIYLVQNVVGGEKDRAFAASMTWLQERINPGHGVESWSNDYGNHIIFGISNSGNLLLLADNSQGEQNVPLLLSYGANQYAALLPLL